MADKNIVAVLQQAIIEVINNQEKSKKELQGEIISGRGNERIQITNIFHMFETYIVTELIKHIIMRKNKEGRNDYKIGWEVPYPREVSGWELAKCDLALDHIEDCNDLFNTVIEVKRAYYKGDMFGEDWELYNVWADIYKIIGYFDAHFPEVGQNKFILVFFPYNKIVSAEKYSKGLEEIFIQKTLFGKENLKHRDFLKNKLGWSENNIAAIWQRPEIQKNDKVEINFENFDVNGRIQKIITNEEVAVVVMRIG